MKPKSVIVLKALLQGHEITICERTYKIKDNNLYLLGYEKEINEKKEPILLNANISLNNFLKECNKLTYDECFIINANIALTEMKREKHGN